MAKDMTRENLVELWKSFASAWKVWYRKAEDNISVLDISIPEYRIMSYLVENGPSPMARLASSASVSQGWVTSMVDRLEKMGLVKRVRGEIDRRIINIEILEAGVRTIKEAREMHLDFVTRSFQNFTEKEREDFKGLMRKLLDNLEDKPLVS